MVLTRKCPRCLEVKPHSEYGFDKYSPHLITTYCLPCKREKDLAWQRAHPERTKEMRRKSRLKNPVTTRVAQQRWNEANKDKIKEMQKRYYMTKRAADKLANPEKYKLHMRKAVLSRRKLTLEDYDRMMADQGGVCAICKLTNVDGRPLGVDHNHKCCGPGDHSCLKCMRGLLCVSCNATLHKLEATEGWIHKALAYLEHHANK